MCNPSPLGFQLYFSGDAHSPCATSKELRHAILYAIDIEGFIQAVYSGYGTPQYSFCGSDAIGFDPKWKEEDYFNYNVDKAKQLLADAGYQPGELTLQFMTLSSDQWSKAAQVIQGYLSVIGINVEILAYETALYASYMDDGANYDFMICNTVSSASSYVHDIAKGKLDMTVFGGKTCCGFVDEVLQEKLELCLYEATNSQETMSDFHYYLKEQAYAVGLASQTNFNFARKELGIIEADYDTLGLLRVCSCTYAD